MLAIPINFHSTKINKIFKQTSIIGFDYFYSISSTQT